MCSVVTEPLAALSGPAADPGTPGRCLEQLEQEICELAAHLAAATCRWLLLISQPRVRVRAGGEGLERRNRAVGIRIDSDTCRPRSAGDRLDYGLAVELLLARALSPT